MNIKTLKETSIQEILEVFNHSFSDYFVPFKLTYEQLLAKMKADKTDLSLSVGTFENETLVGFILHGFDVINHKKIAYNGGTGVIPEKRGLGLTKQMYSYILPILKTKGINKLQLEVISNNIQAIKSYQKAGFEIKRNLSCFKGTITSLPTNSTIKIKPITSYNWELMESFWSVSPTWQNASNTLQELTHIHTSLGAYYQNQLVGYVIYNPSSNRIQQIAIDKAFRKQKIASSLINKLLKGNETKFSVINVDNSNQELCLFFEKIGLSYYLEQLEMQLNL